MPVTTNIVNLLFIHQRYSKLITIMKVHKRMIFVIIILLNLFIHPASSQTAVEWNNKGFALDESGEYNKAIEAYNKAIAIDPNYKIAWNNKGVAFVHLGEYKKAIEAFDRSIIIDPNDKEVWFIKGSAFAALGEYEKTIEASDRALAIDPDYKEAWYGKGIAFIYLGEYEKATEAFDKALAIDPNYKEAWEGKGLVFYELGDYNKATEAYDKALDMSEGQENDWIIIGGLAIFIIIGIIALRNRKNKSNNDTLRNPNNTDYKINEWKKFCQKCGAELKEDSNFCSSCGFSLQNATVQEEKTGLIKHFWGLVKLSFVWSGRFSRREFATLYLGGALISFFIVVIIIEFNIWLESVVLLGIEIIIMLIWAIMAYNAAIRRFHDMNKSGWHVLLLFIPLINLYFIICLFFEKGKEIGETRWG